jgi:hypothetical protein
LIWEKKREKGERKKEKVEEIGLDAKGAKIPANRCTGIKNLVSGPVYRRLYKYFGFKKSSHIAARSSDEKISKRTANI